MHFIYQENRIFVALREILHDPKQIRILRQGVGREIQRSRIGGGHLFEQNGFSRATRADNADEMPPLRTRHRGIQGAFVAALPTLAYRQVVKLQKLGE